jgi:ferrous iron transport protein B
VIENGSALYPYIRAAFTPVQAYAFMAFALLSAPCIAALAAMKKELVSLKWFLFALVYEMGVAYLVAFLIYQIGSMSSGGILTIVFLLVVIGIVASTGYRVFKNKGSTCVTCSGCVVDKSCTRSELERKSNTDVTQE